MEKTSYREYLVWMVFLEEEWNKPTRSDYYLMQLSQQVGRIFAKNPNRIKLKDFVLKFTKDGKQVLSEEEKQRHLEASKARWFGLLGIKDKKDGDRESSS